MADMEERPTPLLDVQPGDMEMDRSEVDPNPPPPPESLRDKLKAHYQKGMKKPSPKMLRGPLSPEIVDNIAIPMYLFTVFAGFYIGVFYMVPRVFEGDASAMAFHRGFISLLCLQMMVNWLGIRYVDSSYPRYLRMYGPPPHEREGKAMDNVLLASTQKLDTSAAKLMPVLSELPESDQVSSHTKTHAFKTDNSLLSSRRKSTLNPTSFALMPAGAAIRLGPSDLKQEVDLANQAMHRRSSQVNSRSIEDLLNPPQKKKSPLPPTPPISEQTDLPTFSVENDAESFETRINEASENPGISTSGGIPGARIGSALTCPTPTVTTDGAVVSQSYPYWSWVPCYDCGWARPPRCHHCPLCKTCVLKRDHHCFFAGSCVGYRNHRFFCVFLVWAWSGAVYGTIYGLPYIYHFLWEDMAYVDLFFPVAFLRWMLGYAPLEIPLTVAAVSFMIYFDGLAGLFIYAHTRLISWGITSFEKAFLRKSLHITDTRSLPQKVRAVFGPYWLVSFLVPVQFFTEPQEDPVLWPDIQVAKH